jgi:tetratricopeptide (TPR) repeat protein
VSTLARALDAAQLALARKAQASLAQGHGEQALEQALALTKLAPQAPDAHQLLGVAAAQAGQHALAEQAFGRALQLAPGHAELLCNRAAMRQQQGRLREALLDLRQATAAQPSLARAWRLRSDLALSLDETAEARESSQRCVALQPRDALAWQSLAYVLRHDGDAEAAEQALVRSIELAPHRPEPWVSLGATRRILGRPDDALRCYARAAELGYQEPDLLHAACGAWVDQGDVGRALALAEQLVARHPDFAPGHATLADLHWEHTGAADADPLGRLIDAARAAPGNQALWQACASKLLRAGRPAEALALIQAAPAAGVRLRQTEADALQADGRGERAEAIYAELLREAGDEAPNPLLTGAAALMLARARPADAEMHAMRAATRQRHDQLAWAYLGTAWRLRGDARADWLWDVERLVTQQAVDEPHLPQLRAALEPMHQAVQAPLEQTLRGGSQTPGMLFGRPDAAVQRLATELRRSIEHWLPSLQPDPSHPVLSRLSRGVRYVGSWSVRLRRSGHHVHHIHGDGWLSSAYHVSLPASVRAAAAAAGWGSASDAGCLVLGVPPAELGLSLPPLRVVRPLEGHLVLFPSCLWHGTVPFEDDEARLTVAFDVQPATPWAQPASPSV